MLDFVNHKSLSWTCISFCDINLWQRIAGHPLVVFLHCLQGFKELVPNCKARKHGYIHTHANTHMLQHYLGRPIPIPPLQQLNSISLSPYISNAENLHGLQRASLLRMLWSRVCFNTSKQFSATCSTLPTGISKACAQVQRSQKQLHTHTCKYLHAVALHGKANSSPNTAAIPSNFLLAQTVIWT